MRFLIALILAAVLPAPGTQLRQLPEGRGKAETEAACYACHSAEILVQQRLTEKQWTASVEKMMRWGAEVSPAAKQPIIEYLARHYGPDNRFVPARTAPVQ